MSKVKRIMRSRTTVCEVCGRLHTYDGTRNKELCPSCRILNRRISNFNVHQNAKHVDVNFIRPKIDPFLTEVFERGKFIVEHCRRQGLLRFPGKVN